MSRTLVERLAAAAASMASVEKGGTNTHFRYDYATHNDVAAAVRAPLFKEGVILLVDINEHTFEDGKTNRGGLKRIHTVKFTATFHGGGESLSVNWIGQGEDADDKGVNKAMSNGVKYLLLKTFLIPSDDAENDVEHSSHDSRRYQSNQAKSYSKPKPVPDPEPPKKFRDLPQERQAKAQAMFFAIAGELAGEGGNSAEVAYEVAGHLLAQDEKKGRGSLTLSTEAQVGAAIKFLDSKLKEAKKSAAAIGLQAKDKTESEVA